jgi:vacuolar protein sorting-associated protein 45
VRDVPLVLVFIKLNINRYVEMLRSAAANFSPSVYDPPPESASTAPILNLNLGGVNVSLGGPAGTGVYRTNGEGVNVQTDGIRDGVMNLFGKVKQGVDRIAIP